MVTVTTHVVMESADEWSDEEIKAFSEARGVDSFEEGLSKMTDTLEEDVDSVVDADEITVYFKVHR